MLAFGEHVNIDFWTAVGVGKSATMMVAPMYDKLFTTELDSAHIEYFEMSDNILKVLNKMPKMKVHNKDHRNGHHSVDWEDYHDLATIYEYLDYLEGN